jgi:hypothetical protein
MSTQAVPSWATAHVLNCPDEGAETFEKMFVATAVFDVFTMNVIVLSVPFCHAPVNLAVAKPPTPPGALGNTLGFLGRRLVSNAWTALATLWPSFCVKYAGEFGPVCCFPLPLKRAMSGSPP